MAFHHVIDGLFVREWHQAPVLEHRPAMLVVIISAVSLVVWRMWTFTVMPLFDKRRPLQLPYWIPCHAVTFLRNPEGLLSFGREYFGDTRQPFALTIAGNTIYVLTSGESVMKAYNNRSTLSFDLLLRDMMKPFASPGIVDKMFKPTTSPLTRSQKSVVHFGHDWQVQQTTGQRLKDLDIRVTRYLNNKLVLREVKLSFSAINRPKNNEVVVSCKKWSIETIICAIQGAYFGDSLSNIDPNLVQALVKFDSSSWRMFNRFPSLLTREMDSEKEKIVDSLRKYFETPKDQRPGESWFVYVLENQYRSLGFSDAEIADLIMFTYWGINTNVSKMGFWTFAHVVHDKNLMGRICDETAMAFSDDGLDVQCLAEQCPVLNSVWLESLRLCTGLSSVRYITDTTEISGKVLQRGDKILISGRQLHLDETVFGKDPRSFDPKRFLENPKLEQHPSFRPFGGGVTLCPGRILAKHAVFSFIALALHRFEIELAMRQPFPRCEETNAGFGVINSNDDLLLRMRDRSG